MSKWPMVRLGDICIIERGGSPRPIEKYITNDDSGVNWIKIGDTTDSMYITSTKEKIIREGMKKSRYVKSGDFLLTNSMSFGRPYILKIDGCIHDGWLLLHDGNSVFDKKFLYYFLSSNSTYQTFKNLAVGGVVNNLNSEMVRNLYVPLPPLPEQKRIAETLDHAQRLIDLRKKQIEEMDRLAQAVFIEMFGDPVRNEKGWETKRLEEVCTKITDGKHGDCNDEPNSGFYFISAKDIYDGYIHYDESRHITQKDFIEVDRRTCLNKDDILITNSGTIGKIATINDYDKMRRTTFQKSVAVISPITTVVLTKYLSTYLFLLGDRLLNTSTGSSQKNLLLGQIRDFLVLVPKMDQQKDYAIKSSQLESRIEKLNAGLSLLIQNSNILVQQLFSY